MITGNLILNMVTSSPSRYQKGHFKFGHSESIVPLFTALELFKDGSPLLATNMAEMTNRKFKSSHISPMAANLAFVLYACPGENSSENKYAVKLLVNEKDTVIPKCGQTLCAYDAVKEAYQQKYMPCNKEALCQYPRTTTGSADLHCQLSMILMATLFSLILS